MKRIVIFFIVAGMLFIPREVQATPPDFCGGVNNEYEYQEIVFLTGEPVKFTGTVTVKETEKNDTKSVSYKFNLTPEDTSIKGKLTRSVKYKIEYTKRDDKGQTIGQTTLDSKPSETVTVDKDSYVLKDYQFSKSDIIDNRPASDYYNGTITGRKYYLINKNEGTATVEISGGSVGYENFWGSTETQIINNVINIDRKTTDKDGETEDLSWEGTVDTQTSDSTAKTLKYAENDASYASFSGGTMRVTNQEMVSEYEYDLPEMDDGIPDSSDRNRDTMELNTGMVPQVERLILPKFRDIAGNWAQDDIEKLYSLDVFTGGTQFFLPEIPMTRKDFTVAVVKATNMRPSTTQVKPTRSSKKAVEVSPFADLPTTDANYADIKEAVSKGIISGVSSTQFMPDGKLTRAQAITILIKALGLENKAPTPGYATSFADDHAIPGWARDYIYAAGEIGLIKGDSYNQANPNQVMTRAEASAMLVNFLNFLQVDLQKDYRDNIMLFN